MLHKCLSITLADIITSFRGIVSGPVAFLVSVCLRKGSISATSALRKLKVIEETKLLLIFSTLGCLSYFLMIPSIISRALFVSKS